MTDKTKSRLYSVTIGILLVFLFLFTRYLFVEPIDIDSFQIVLYFCLYLTIGLSVGLISHHGERAPSSAIILCFGLLNSIRGGIFGPFVFIMIKFPIYLLGLWIGRGVSQATYEDAFPTSLSRKILSGISAFLILELLGILVFKDAYVILTRTTPEERATNLANPPYFFSNSGERIKALTHIARQDMQRHDFEHAQKRFERALAIASSSEPEGRDNVVIDLITSKMEFGFLEEALQVAEKLIPDTEGRRNLLIGCYRNAGLYNEAIAEVKKIKDPIKRFEALKGIAEAQINKNKLSDAKRTIEMLMQMRGKHWVNLRRPDRSFHYHLLAQAGFYEDALRVGSSNLPDSNQFSVVRQIAFYAAKRDPKLADDFWNQVIQTTMNYKGHATRMNHLASLCSLMAESKMCEKARATTELIDSSQAKEAALRTINIQCPIPKLIPRSLTP